jgi:GT2 family glycosyltransferase
MSNAPKVIIGIPTYNGFQRVDYLLQSIYQSIHQSGKGRYNTGYLILICDDSGQKEHQEKTKLVVDKWNSFLPVKFLVNKKNLGVSKTWNRIVKDHDSKYIILINDDIIVSDNWLDSMLYFLENNLNAGVAYYNYAPLEESNIPEILFSGYKSPFDSSVPIRCMHYVGCFFGFARDKYDLVGGFDENYFANFEETDFSTSLASHGFPNYILKYPMCLHISSATFKSAPELNYSNILNESNQYYIKKWDGDREIVTNRYMSNIPFQKVKWTCHNIFYEGIIKDRYGYFKIERINDNTNNLLIDCRISKS